ncbi:hypothetical protein BGX34_009860, partial [Mortierella sp. NVP85]
VIWDILTGDLEHILSGHSYKITDVVYSPQGYQVASASEDDSVKLWDVETGDCLHTLAGHDAGVNCIAYSPNGSQIASGSDDSTVRLWDVETGNCNHILQDYGKRFWKVVYSPQGDRVASSYDDFNGYTARLWNVAPEPGDCPSAVLTSIRTDDLFVYSPKGDQVASTKDCNILLWDVKTEKLLYTLAGHIGEATQIVYSPQGDIVASAGSDDTIVRLWSAETGDCLRLLAGHSQDICSMVFSPKGDRIISSSLDKTVRIWDVGVRTSQRTSGSHNGRVHMVKCSPKGDQVASCSGDMTVRLWDVETGSCRHILRGHSKEISCIAYSSEGDQIATGSDDDTVRLWDTETGRCTHTLTDHSDKVLEIVYSPQKDRLATFNIDGTVQLWGVGSGERLHSLCSGVQNAALSPNWGHIATRSKGIVQLRDVETGDCTGELRGVDDVESMIWSPQGDQIAMISWGVLTLWKIKSNRQDDDKNQAGNESDGGFSLYNSWGPGLAKFSPNGAQIACTRSDLSEDEQDFTLYLHDTVTETQLWASEGHTKVIASIVYSSRGDLIVTASGDQTVRLWDAISGQCRAVIQDFQHEVRDIAWVETPSAQYVFAGCEDGVVGMWQVIMDEDRCQVRLHWKTTNGLCNLAGAIWTRSCLREGSNEEATVATVLPRIKDASDVAEEYFIELNNDGVGHPSFNVLSKRFLELHEEYEDVAKRMRGNEGVSSMEE